MLCEFPGQQWGQDIYCEMKTFESNNVENHYTIRIIGLVDLNLPAATSDIANLLTKVYFGIKARHVTQTQLLLWLAFLISYTSFNV